MAHQDVNQGQNLTHASDPFMKQPVNKLFKGKVASDLIFCNSQET